MNDFTTKATKAMIDPVTGEIIDRKDLAERLLVQAKEQGVSLVGPGGLLNQLTKNVLETALEDRADRAPRTRARVETYRGKHAQRHSGEDRADRDRPCRPFAAGPTCSSTV